jgi:microcystin-dependent protein
MATEPYLGEIRAFAFGFAPRTWAPCNGQLLAINSNTALFSILGTTYGGNGITTFALPNLQGSVGVHQGNGIVLGQTGGSQTVSLTTNQVGHTHSVSANATANSYTAASNFPASAPSGDVLYGPTANTPMSGAILSAAGGSQAHNNLQPYLVVMYCIALAGIFPSRN